MPDPIRPPQTLQDSLQALVGGPQVPVHESSRALGLLGFPFRVASGLGNVAAGDVRGGLETLTQRRGPHLLGLATNVPGMKQRIFVHPVGTREEREARETLIHEFGHIADFRKTFPDAAKVIDRTAPSKEARGEHYADTFMSVMALLQSPASHRREVMQRLTRRMPEEQKVMLQSLLSHPLYKDHPLNQKSKGLLAMEGE